MDSSDSEAYGDQQGSAYNDYLECMRYHPLFLLHGGIELMIAKLSPNGYEELDRAKLIEPSVYQLHKCGGVCRSDPAFANTHVFIRNDR